MATSVTPDAISFLHKNPTPESPDKIPQIVVQVVDLKPISKNRFTFHVTDGKEQLKAMLQSSLSYLVINGNIRNLGLIRVVDYTLNTRTNKDTTEERFLIITKCEAVSTPLEAEFKVDVKKEEPGILLKPKQAESKVEVKKEESVILLKPKQETVVTKSAAQIVQEQNGNMAPAARMAMTRRVHPLASINPYQGNWMIKVCVTSKGTMYNYKNARGEGCVFNVELTDEDGTQIQATMFNEAAKKFYDVFEMGKVYYISKGTLKIANKQFKTVQNDYSMTLNENSIVEEVVNEAGFIAEPKFDFVPIDELGPYTNKQELIDVIGVLQNVSPTVNIKRKRDNESIPKRDIVIADNTKKSVVVSLWNSLATDVGEELSEMVDMSPVIAFKSLKVSDFQGVSLSTVGKSIIKINPDTPESQNLRSWYSSEGKETTIESAGAGLSSLMMNGGQALYTNRATLGPITNNQSLGEDKPVVFHIRACMSLIRPDQNMFYQACKHCKKKVIDNMGSGWCEACQKSDWELKYIFNAKFSDATGGAWFTVFGDDAAKIIGCSAEELDNMKSQGGETEYVMQLKKATWVPYVFRVGVAQKEYNNEKRQKITVRGVAPLDFAAESKLLLKEIFSKKA